MNSSMLFTSPGNVIFSVCGFDIYYYGVLMGLAIVVGLFVANKFAEVYYDYKNTVLDIAPIILLGGILGARLYFCVLNPSYYFHNVLEILDFRGGGLSIHGAFLGGIVSLFILARKNRLDFAKICDSFIFALPLAQAIGRWGNFFNSEAFGRPTNLSWGVYIPVENRPDKYLDNSFFHPTFLYESVLDILIFGILIYLLKTKKLKAGNLTAIYFILYSAVRILVESVRIDCTTFLFGIPLPILISVVIIISGSFYLFKNSKISE